MRGGCRAQQTPRTDRCFNPRPREEVRPARADAQRRFRRMRRRGGNQEAEAEDEEEVDPEEEGGEEE